jgi:hypothetical protein
MESRSGSWECARRLIGLSHMALLVESQWESGNQLGLCQGSPGATTSSGSPSGRPIGRSSALRDAAGNRSERSAESFMGFNTSTAAAHLTSEE